MHNLSSPDEVLCGQGLKNGDCEDKALRLFPHHLLGQYPLLTMVDVLVLRVFHPDVPLH